ncbi:helix-turn-helix domain-containing protein [Butyrivibrio sp. MC2013]|uniref:helix-turn-helix domain-containing protein n=1 Tax=Butyrivibrio sp. MC2013 TaxID=1280686 RepID=UPI00041B82EC|nr:helix-turn-helix transcriptional regulator [Butyrivibrio sp. MC2013]
MSIGTNIKELREERKLTQEQVAESLGITFQAVSSWERDEYKPDTDKLIRLAEIFDVSVSAIAEEKRKTFKTREAIYNWEHMKTYVKTTARNFKLKDTLKAVDYAVEAHEGQKRKKSKVPYIYHPLNLACHALSMGIVEDEIIAACLLHDVIEDCGKTIDELPVNEETKELVRLLTCEKTNDDNRDQIVSAYYKEIVANTKAALIKCMDRCNNLTTMSWGLSRDRIYRMIKETEEYYPALIKTMKATPEYNNAAWLLQYQIESMLDIYKRLM